MTKEPNPGSHAATQAGCTCPVMDNCYGKFPPFPAGTEMGGKDGSWWIDAECPIHGNHGELVLA